MHAAGSSTPPASAADVITAVLKWSEDFIEQPHEIFGDLPVCPFARAARLKETIRFEVRPFALDDPLDEGGELLRLVGEFARQEEGGAVYPGHAPRRWHAALRCAPPGRRGHSRANSKRNPADDPHFLPCTDGQVSGSAASGAAKLQGGRRALTFRGAQIGVSPEGMPPGARPARALRSSQRRCEVRNLKSAAMLALTEV